MRTTKSSARARATALERPASRQRASTASIQTVKARRSGRRKRVRSTLAHSRSSRQPVRPCPPRHRGSSAPTSHLSGGPVSVARPGMSPPKGSRYRARCGKRSQQCLPDRGPSHHSRDPPLRCYGILNSRRDHGLGNCPDPRITRTWRNVRGGPPGQGLLLAWKSQEWMSRHSSGNSVAKRA